MNARFKAGPSRLHASPLIDLRSGDSTGQKNWNTWVKKSEYLDRQQLYIWYSIVDADRRCAYRIGESNGASNGREVGLNY